MEDKFIYRKVMGAVNGWLQKAPSKADKIAVLDYAADIIANEWIAFSQAEILNEKDVNLIRRILPRKYPDENGIMKESAKGVTEIDFRITPVVVSAWNVDRLTMAIADVKANGFIYDEDNHIMDYIPELNIAVAYNGFHHITAAAYWKTGKARAAVVSLQELYPHLKTDGCDWYNAHTGSYICAVPDLRFAALYSIKQLAYKLENDLTPETTLLEFSDKITAASEYKTENTITIEQLVDCVKNHRTINGLSLRAFAKEAGITFAEAFKFEHSSYKREVLEKIMKALGIDKCFTLIFRT